MTLTGKPYFVAGGTLSDSVPSYVEREADRDLFAALLNREFCFVLDTRQVGKSSLLVHAAKKLRANHQAVAILDLTSLGENLSIETWYYGLLNSLSVSLGLEEECEEFWIENAKLGPCQRLFACLYKKIAHAIDLPITIFVDEIDAVCKLAFSTDEFFTGIRETYNRRALETNPADIAFCLSGVAQPSNLIVDPRSTPFNIGRSITLSDFSSTEIETLGTGLAGSLNERRSQIERVRYWTGGHPYLTQKLCHSICQTQQPLNKSEIDHLCKSLFFTAQAKEQEYNLQFVSKQLLTNDTERADLLSLYRGILSGRNQTSEGSEALLSHLILAGLVKKSSEATAHAFEVRNRIYRTVFDRNWVKANLPDAEVRRQRRAVALGFLRASTLWAVFGALGLLAWYQARRAELEAVGHIKEKKNVQNAIGKLHVTEQERKAAQEQTVAVKTKLSAVQSHLERLALKQTELTSNIKKEQAKLSLAQSDTLRERKKRAQIETQSQQQLADRVGELSGPLASALASHSGDELNAIKFALASIHRLDELKRPITSSAMQGLADATSVGVYRHLRLKLGFAVISAMFYPDTKRFGKEIHHSGERLIAVGENRFASIWDVATGKEVQRLEVIGLKDRPNNVNYAEYSPDGNWILTADDNSRVQVWDANDPRPLVTEPKLTIDTKSIHFTTACFSRNMKSILTTGSDGAAFVWDFERFLSEQKTGAKGRAIWTSENQHPVTLLAGDPNDYLWSITFSTDGKLVATGSNEGRVSVWDLESRKQVLQHAMHRPEKSASPVYSLTFDQDNGAVISAGKDKRVFEWDIKNNKLFAEYTGHTDQVFDVSRGGSNLYITSASRDRVVRVWQFWSQNQPLYELKTHAERVWSSRFSPDASQLATASSDGTVDIWRFPLPTFPMQGVSNMSTFSPDGKELMGAGNDGYVHSWELGIGETKTPRSGNKGYCNWTEYSPDGRWIFSSYQNSAAILWDRGASRHGEGFISDFYSSATGIRGNIKTASFSPDSRHIVTSSDDGNASIWSVPDLHLEKNFQIREGKMCSAFFSPDGNRVVTSGSDGAVRVWSVQTGINTHTLLPPGRSLKIKLGSPYPSMARFSLNGDIILSADTDHNAYAWEVKSGKFLGALEGHTGELFGIAISPKGGQAATCSKDQSVLIWNLHDLQTKKRIRPYYRLCRQNTYVNGISYSPDGEWLTTASSAGVSMVYPATLKKTEMVANRILHHEYLHSSDFLLPAIPHNTINSKK